MKQYKLLILLLLAAFIFIWGCGTNEKEAEPTTETNTELTDDQKIGAMLQEMIDRVKEGDKTVLYEMEFPYYTDSVSLSMYMENPRVLDYKYDTLGSLSLDSVIYFDGDSATAVITITYNSLAGESERTYPLKVYKYKGRWVKPYMSSYAHEVEYQELLKAYYDAVKNEESGQ